VFNGNECFHPSWLCSLAHRAHRHRSVKDRFKQEIRGRERPVIPETVTYGPARRTFLKEITIMRTIASLLAAGLLACAISASAADERGSEKNAGNGSVVRDGTPNGEYGNECSWGLANGKHVKTDCSVNMTGENGKTYCFSNDRAMAAFMKNPAINTDKASKTYSRG
jgi:YHS domain-containing protein